MIAGSAMPRFSVPRGRTAYIQTLLTDSLHLPDDSLSLHPLPGWYTLVERGAANLWSRVRAALTARKVFYSLPDVIAPVSRGRRVESADRGLLADAGIAEAASGLTWLKGSSEPLMMH